MRRTVDAPGTLSDWLRRAFPDASGRTRKQMLEQGRVRVNDRIERRAATALAPGDRVEVGARTGPPPTGLPPTLSVVHDDPDLLVVEKGPGLLTIASDEEREETVHALLLHHVRQRDPRARVFIVHRLDREASGLLVLARTVAAKCRLQEQFRAHGVERLYHALVVGRPAAEAGVIDSRLVEGKSGRVHETRRADAGRPARTHWRLLRPGTETSLIEVRLETGRKHQIRVHLAAIGHPIVGDTVYGRGRGPLRRLALHATTLGFVHPTSGARVRFESALPRALRRLGVP